MYRIDGIYNSGYAHAPALIVNPSGSYPLIYNSSTAILQQTPNDQKVDKASDVEFKSVKTGLVKSPTGNNAINIDDAGSISAQNGISSQFGVTIANLQLQKLSNTNVTYGIQATGVNDRIKIYSTRGVTIGNSSCDFLFEPSNLLFNGPSFRVATGASIWTPSIKTSTGATAIDIADNKNVSIPNLVLTTIKPTSIWTPSIKFADGTSAINIGIDDFVIKSWGGANAISIAQSGLVSIPNLMLTTIKPSSIWTPAINSSTGTIAIDIGDDGLVSIPNLLLLAVKTSVIQSTTGINAINIDNSGNVSIPSLPFKVLTVQGSGSYPLVYDSATGLLTQTSINQALSTTSSPTFAGLSTVGSSTRAPIKTNSTAGYSSSPVFPADLDVYDINLRSGNLYTGTATTLQTTSKLSIGKALTINSNNGTTLIPHVDIRPGLATVPLWIGAGSNDSAVIVGTTGLVQIDKLEVTNTLTVLKAKGGVDAGTNEVACGRLYANAWSSNPADPAVYVEQAVATPTGPKFTNGIHVNKIMHPAGDITFINLDGPRPSFPEGFDVSLFPVDGGSLLTYNAATKSVGYKLNPNPTTSAYIRFGQNNSPSYLDNYPSTNINSVQTYYYSIFGGGITTNATQFPNRGYPPFIDTNIGVVGGNPNIYISFSAQTPADSLNFPNTWDDSVKQKFPALGQYMITWTLGSFNDPRRLLLSINLNWNIASTAAAGNDSSAIILQEYFTHTMDNGTSLTAIVNISSLSDYVTYSIYNYDARTWIAGQGRNMLSVVKVGAG